MNEEKIDKTVFDRKEAARRLGISVVTVDRQLAKKRLPHFRVGNRVLFNQKMLDQFIDQNTKYSAVK